MNFALSDEQEELRRTVRSFLEQKSPESEVRRVMETDEGYAAAVWDQMAQQLGLQGLIVPDDLGGSGYSFRELAVVLEEMGRALLPTPFLSSAVMATSALLHAGDAAAAKELLPALASGEAIATLALGEGNGRWDETGVELAARPSGDGFLLSGTKRFVLDGHVADIFVVAGRTEGGVSLFAVDGAAPGLTRTPLSTMDQTRRLAHVDLVDVPGRLIGTEGGAWPGIERTLQLAAVGLAAEQVGGAQRCLEMSVQYAQDRIQFGRPIGSFQAVKHKCADMLLHVELARSAAQYGAWCAAELDGDLPVAAAMAKSYCSEAYFAVAAETIQVHGGIGFTWEHPAHLYFKRAKSSELLLGAPVHHRRLLARQLAL